MVDVGILYVHLVNFPAIWHTLLTFGMFSPVLVHFYPFLGKKNLASLVEGLKKMSTLISDKMIYFGGAANAAI
jgi:hypothetical protein